MTIQRLQANMDVSKEYLGELESQTQSLQQLMQGLIAQNYLSPEG